MTVVAERTESAAPIELQVDANGGATGLTVVAAVRDAQTANSWLDFADLTFKTAGWTTRQTSLTEVSAGNAPGAYRLTGGLDISSITNLPAATDNLIVEYDVSGTVTLNVNEQIQLVNSFLDSAGDTWEETRASHTTAGTFGESVALTSDGLATSAVDEIADGVWDEPAAGHVAADTFGERLGRRVAIRTTATAGSSPTEIRTGLTQANDFFNNMPVLVVNAAGIVARNINDYANTNGAITVDALPFTPTIGDPVLILGATGSVPVDTAAIGDAVWDEDIVAAHGGSDTAGLLLRALGAVISQRSNNPTLDALLAVPDVAANTIAHTVWDEPIASHLTAGSTGEALDNAGGSGSFTVQSIVNGVWDEPIASHLTVGSTGAKLNDTAEPSDVRVFESEPNIRPS